MSSTLNSKPSTSGRITLALGIVIFFHSAYSTYEHLSLRKSLDLEQTSVPKDITAETLISLAVIIAGVLMTASPLKEITWSSEMRQRSIEESDARTSFAPIHNRGANLFGTEGQ